jgi:hypothetical protein
LKYQIQLCRKCGYCWPDISKERKREKITTTLNAPLAFDDTAALFARAAEIEIADNAPSFASYMLYMKAAWVMDDLKNGLFGFVKMSTMSLRTLPEKTKHVSCRNCIFPRSMASTWSPASSFFTSWNSSNTTNMRSSLENWHPQ